MAAARVEVARHLFRLEDDEQFAARLRESPEYAREPVAWEAIFDELSEADRSEAREPVLARALALAQVDQEDLPRLALASLIECEESGALVSEAARLLPRLVDAGFGEVAHVMRLRFLLSEIDDDPVHRSAYVGDLVSLARSSLGSA